jgi:hypothetical protein
VIRISRIRLPGTLEDPNDRIDAWRFEDHLYRDLGFDLFATEEEARAHAQLAGLGTDRKERDDAPRTQEVTSQ